MDRDKRTWLIAFLVLVIAVLALSSTGVITGKSTLPRADAETLAKVYVSSDKNVVDIPELSVKRGANLFVTIETGSEGIYNRVRFFQGKECIGRQEAVFNLVTRDCGGNYCTQDRIVSGSYKIGTDWNGEYCACVKDRAIDQFVEKCFNVV